MHAVLPWSPRAPLPHLDSPLALGNEHDAPERRNLLILSQLDAAIVPLRRVAQDLDDDARIDGRVAALGIALDLAAHDGDVRVGGETGREHAHAQIRAEHAARPA